MLDVAISITAQAFEGRFDKGGKPYVLHCLHVMNAVSHYNDDDLSCAAVMHDLVEDTPWTLDELAKVGFSARVITTLALLTHVENVTYDDYIKAIATNEDARRIKLADLRHNSDILRMKGLRKKDFDRMEKYHRSFVYLSGV